MPAIHAKSLLALVEAIRNDDLGQTKVWRAVAAVLTLRVLEVPGAAEVILGTSAGDSWEIGIAIHIELNLAFTPPTAGVHAPGDVGANVLALPLHAIEQGVHIHIRQRVGSSPLGVEVGG